MKKYFEALAEQHNPSQIILTYKGRTVRDTEHAVQRFHERFPGVPQEKYFDILRKGIDTIIDVFKDSRGKYVIVNKATGIAIQLDWRADRFGPDKTNHGFTATTLDYVQHKAMLLNDTKMFVEGWSEDLPNKLLILPECDCHIDLCGDKIVGRNFHVIEVE